MSNQPAVNLKAPALGGLVLFAMALFTEAALAQGGAFQSGLAVSPNIITQTPAQPGVEAPVVLQPNQPVTQGNPTPPVVPPVSIEPDLSLIRALPACSAPAPGQSLTCACDHAATDRSVWGSGPYTADSDVCTAAAHANAVPVLFVLGVLQANGPVEVEGGPGCTSYTGSTANGVTTRNFNSWPASFHFPSVGQAPCAANPMNLPACPAAMPANLLKYACVCPDTANTTGSVWGTDLYTDDSRLCLAARHAGFVDPAGGLIRAVRSAGQSSYTGSTRNGITSSNYGSWPNSISFR